MKYAQEEELKNCKARLVFTRLLQIIPRPGPRQGISGSSAFQRSKQGATYSCGPVVEPQT